MVSVFSLSYGIGQLPSGWLADRIGPRIMITVGICGVALAGFLVGLSQTYIMLIVLLALMGMVGGGYHPSATPLISTSVKPENRGRALGFHLIGGSISFSVAPLIAAAIAAIRGWRGSFIGLSIPTMIYGIIFYVLLGRRAKMSKTPQTTTDSHDGASFSPSYLRRLVVFMILHTFTQAVTFSTVAFIPLFMVDHFGVSEKSAAAFIAIIFSAGLWASPLGGYLSDRLGNVPVTLATCLITGPVIYLLTLVSFNLGIYALLVLIGIVMYIRMPAAESYIISQVPESRRSTIYGIFYFAGMEAGGLLTPVMGFFIDRFGFYFSFTIAGIAVVVVTLICSVFLRGKQD